MLDGKKSTAERIVYDALAIIAERSDKDPVETLEASIKVAHPDARGQIPPRRWRHLPGPRRGRLAPGPHAGGALAGRVRPPAPREDDGPAARQRADGRASHSRAAPTSARTTSTAWPRPTRPSRTTAGRSRRVTRRCRVGPVFTRSAPRSLGQSSAPSIRARLGPWATVPGSARRTATVDLVVPVAVPAVVGGVADTCKKRETSPPARGRVRASLSASFGAIDVVEHRDQHHRVEALDRGSGDVPARRRSSARAAPSPCA